MNYCLCPVPQLVCRSAGVTPDLKRGRVRGALARTARDKNAKQFHYPEHAFLRGSHSMPFKETSPGQQPADV